MNIFWTILIAFAAGYLAASFIAALTGYNFANFFIKAGKYAEEEGKAVKDQAKYIAKIGKDL